MSSSRAEPLRRAATVAVLALAACLGPGEAVAPDAPRPARDPAIFAQRAGPVAPPRERTVELRSARVLAVRGDPLLERLAGLTLLRTARSPLAIEVITAAPLGDVARSASAEIHLNGERLGETWPLPPDRLVLVLPDARRLLAPLKVTVAWLGDEEGTRSRHPLILTEEQLRPFR